MEIKVTLKNIGNFVLTIIIILAFCLFAIIANEATRNFLGVIFLVIGFIVVRFQHRVGEIFYNRQIDLIKRRSSVDKFALQARQMGTRLLITGALFFIITAVFRVMNMK